MSNYFLPFRYIGKLLLVLFVTTGLSTFAQAQQITVTGQVSNKSGEPLAGTSINVKGTPIVVLANEKGAFSISCKGESTLVFSYSGFEPQEKPVSGTTDWRIILQETQSVLGEVIVTALGVERKSGQLTYATQKVAGSELVKVPQTNLMNALSGKVAGVNITQNTSGTGGSVKVIIRGSKSINSNNQPLYVIDGMPIVNKTTEAINSLGSSTDLGGDGISNLNPNDIESISVLKGPSAASLYGSQAANGVILITTKKGKSGIRKVDVSSGATFDKVAYLPKFQNSFGQTAPGSEDSWGPAINHAPDNVSGFYKTGLTLVNAASFSSGNDRIQTYASYANTRSTGVLENNKFLKHNLNFRSTSNFFDNKLNLDANVNVVFQQRDNPAVSGLQLSTAYGLFKFPRGMDISPYKEYEIFDPVRNVMTQNWPFISSSNQNPYWIMNRMRYAYDRDRIMINLTARYDITNWLNFRLRGSIDKSYNANKNQNYYGTTPVYSGPGGYSSFSLTQENQLYGEALLSANKKYEDWGINLILGSSVTDSRNKGLAISSNRLFVPNVFTLNNFTLEPGTSYSQLSESPNQMQSVFGNLSVSFRDWVILDATARNDWSSTLSYTDNPSFFYPSVGTSILLDRMVTLPDVISYAKLRASYSIVGNTVPLFVTNPVNYVNGGSVSFNTTVPFTDIKPEKTKSFEVGIELGFFENRLNIDLTYYKTNSINQFFTVTVPPGTGYTQRYVNAGNIQNQGIEAVLSYSLVQHRNFGWNTAINFSKNKNKVLELAEGFDQFVLAIHETGFTNMLTVGGSYGDIYGLKIKRDEMNRVAISTQGNPVIDQNKVRVGNANPDFLLGWKNAFNYKNILFSVLIDGRFGGDIMSLSQQLFDLWGISETSGEARLNGGVAIDGYLDDGAHSPVSTADPEIWFKTLGSSALGEYMYDATTIRIRELSIGYSIPSHMLKSKFIKNITLSAIGRNLLYIYKPAPVDSELSFSVGNGFQGIDALSIPATRSLGISLNLTF